MMRDWIITGTCLIGFFAGAVSAQDAGAPTPPGGAAAAAGPEGELTDAERIARLKRTIEENEKQHNQLKQKLEPAEGQPESEYAKAEKEFQAIDREIGEKRKELAATTQTADETAIEAMRAKIAPIEERWKLAKERFDIAIQERKTLQEQFATLDKKLQQDRQALDKLLAPPTTQPAAGATPTTPPGAVPTTQPVPQPAAPTAAEQQPTATPAMPPIVPGVMPAMTGTASTSGQPSETKAPGILTGPPAKPPSKELVEAQQKADVKEAEAREAQISVDEKSERIESVQAMIRQEQSLLETARKKVENAQKTRKSLLDLNRQRWTEGAKKAELQKLSEQIDEARQRYDEAHAEVAAIVDRIARHHEELQRLQAEQIVALQEAEDKQAESEKAQKKVEALQNPFAPRNLLQWFLSHGVRVIGFLAGMLGLLWLIRRLEKRIVKLIAGLDHHGAAEERENRAKTLVGAFHYVATMVIVAGGSLMILTELGVNIAPLLGGAAVIGLAVAFGAQNLIKDYFYGFMILLENQYAIHDVVSICGISGQVERITLRVTVLRDLEGIVHFIPNGQITTVSNRTHGWSRALFNIGVAYKEDVNRVMKVLIDLGKEMRRDPVYSGLILDDPEMLGVDSFEDSAVVIKFFIKTRPLQQWTVKRELLRRIKMKFDELGIEIPFPHRTVFHRYENGAPPLEAVETGRGARM